MIDIKHIAKLARIELSQEEADEYTGELDKILNYFKELQEVNTENVLPMFGGTDLENVFRADDDIETGDSSVLRDAFPKEKDGYLSVPKIM